jgi:hypothetical protein
VRVVPSAAGPEAELARLVRPTGPWIHLLDAAPADARQLGWLLGQDGIVVRHLRGHCGRSTYGLLDEIGAALQLPGDPVEDWAGLAALLTDMSWLPGAGHVLVVSRSSLLLACDSPAELGGLVEVVREVARARAEEGEPVPFHLVLQDDTLGLAALRARLDAVGARYAELVGWDAEEPSAGTAVSARSSLTGGPVDPVDRAAAVAVSTVEGVRSLGRAWESFRGGSGGAVRVYVPVLGGPVDLVAVTGSLSAAVAAAGACCVVAPVPADPALADPRQAAVAAAATQLWPHPAPELPAHPAEPPAEPSAEPSAESAAEPAAESAAESAAVPAAGPGAGSEGGLEPIAAGTVTAEWAAERGGAEPAPAAGDVPGDAPGAAFELIAANLQWPFDGGSEQDDPVDAALRAHAESSRRTAALFRTWVHDPAGSWVRVVLGYVNRGSIADVDAERTALVDILQKAGAARCCVEVLAVSDVTDAHRWLEARSHPLWTASHTTTPTSDSSGDAPQAALTGDVVFRAGPGMDDPVHGGVLAGLVEWAGGRGGVVALVTAYTGEDRMVVGAALDADADPEEVRASAPAPVAPFVPARGLDPVHLRLSRSSTRIWTRRTERAQPEPVRPSAATTLHRPDLPKVVDQGPVPVRDTDDPRGDIAVGGFTLVGIDRETAVGKGDPQPDRHDAALVEFARSKDGVIALLRGTTDEGLKVYCLAVEETVDPEVARRELAVAAAATGLTRAALEAFAPAGAISAFHLDLAVGTTRLWPTKS